MDSDNKERPMIEMPDTCIFCRKKNLLTLNDMARACLNPACGAYLFCTGVTGEVRFFWMGRQRVATFVQEVLREQLIEEYVVN